MDKYKKILVAFDGSESGRNALRETLKFAADEHCQVTVVSVIPSYEGDLSALWTNNIKSSMRKQCDMALSEALNLAQKEGVTIETVCAEGEIYERIVDLADMGNFDLIVTGKKGMSLLGRAFVGSVTARVIGYSRQDVLVVPDGAKIAWKKLLVATDGSVYSEAAAQRVIEISRQYHSTLKALSVVDVTVEFMIRAQEVYESLLAKAKEFTDVIKKKALLAGIEADSIVRDGEVYKVIIDVAKEYQADMIVMGSLGRTGIKRLLMGSTAERVLGNASYPVLIVKP
ncbi:MAG: universal stress protein [Nitrospirae bacterium]|jgi:nucleotide-binding universal stress UspA family protein|nr:universal stress protein [Nitrospirota bacterium]